MAQFTGATIGNYTKSWLISIGIFELALAGFFVFMGVAVPGAGGAMNATAIILGAVGVVLVFLGVRAGGKAADTERVLSGGLDGTATIVGLTQTGLYVNEQPQIKMDLQVACEGRAPYAATHKEIVPLMLLSKVENGATLPVKVSANDPNDVAIDWARA